MSESRSLSSRIEAEFAAVEKNIKNMQMDGLREHRERRARLQRLDDRIIDFVRTYISMGESNAYTQQHTVEDPVVHVRFPDFAAGATFEWQGQKHYFIGDQTRQEFRADSRGETGKERPDYSKRATCIVPPL